MSAAERNIGSKGEVSSRALGLVSKAVSFDTSDLESDVVQTAMITAGMDPEAVDRDSLDYAFGVSDALNGFIFWLGQYKNPQTEQFIEENGGDVMLRVIAENPGASLSTLAERAGQSLLSFGRKFSRLRRSQLLEPSIPAEPGRTGWQLTPGAINVYARHEARRVERELTESIRSRYPQAPGE